MVLCSSHWSVAFIHLDLCHLLGAELKQQRKIHHQESSWNGIKMSAWKCSWFLSYLGKKHWKMFDFNKNEPTWGLICFAQVHCSRGWEDKKFFLPLLWFPRLYFCFKWLADYWCRLLHALKWLFWCSATCCQASVKWTKSKLWFGTFCGISVRNVLQTVFAVLLPPLEWQIPVQMWSSLLEVHFSL